MSIKVTGSSRQNTPERRFIQKDSTSIVSTRTTAKELEFLQKGNIPLHIRELKKGKWLC